MYANQYKMRALITIVFVLTHKSDTKIFILIIKIAMVSNRISIHKVVAKIHPTRQVIFREPQMSPEVIDNVLSCLESFQSLLSTNFFLQAEKI